MWFKSSLAAIALGLAAVTATQAAEEVKMGVSIPAATHGWTGGINFHAQQAKERLEKQYPNLKIVLVSAPDAARQANDLEDLVSIHQINTLVILPFESDPLTDPVRQVKEAGVFITVVDRGLRDPSIQDIYVAGNNPQMGRISGEYMRKRLEGKSTKIVVLRGIPTVIDNQRFDAFMEAIKGSDIEVLASQFANWNRDDGFKVMQDFLARFPQIDAVWAQDDDISLGAMEAIRQAGRQDKLFVVGGAGMKDIVKRVMDGDKLIPVDVTYSPTMIADAMEITAGKMAGGKEAKKEYIIDSVLITPENAKQFYYPDSPF
jgi:ribose transport system substrate-binding protein